mmetsp:Transcript_15571/g.23143  ORF Transcript_15571/g.23143 Transcript_15571/m.23143 type:complete len:99 (-) Transcript_15571:255-551(-)
MCFSNSCCLLALLRGLLQFHPQQKVWRVLEMDYFKIAAAQGFQKEELLLYLSRRRKNPKEISSLHCYVLTSGSMGPTSPATLIYGIGEFDMPKQRVYQ